jgi:hypothetical protein
VAHWDHWWPQRDHCSCASRHGQTPVTWPAHTEISHTVSHTERRTREPQEPHGRRFLPPFPLKSLRAQAGPNNTGNG